MKTKREGSGLWKHGLLLTMLFGFTVMLVGGAYIYKTRAPIPARVADGSGGILFTAADIEKGQELFRKRNLMNYGSVLGHGAYLGPDYTAEALHWMTEAMRTHKTPDYRALSVPQQAAVDTEIGQELRENRYYHGVLRFAAAQLGGGNSVVDRS